MTTLMRLRETYLRETKTPRCASYTANSEESSNLKSSDSARLSHRLEQPHQKSFQHPKTMAPYIYYTSALISTLIIVAKTLKCIQDQVLPGTHYHTS